MSNVTVKKTGTPTIYVIEDERGVCYIYIYNNLLVMIHSTTGNITQT